MILYFLLKTWPCFWFNQNFQCTFLKCNGLYTLGRVTNKQKQKMCWQIFHIKLFIYTVVNDSFKIPLHLLFTAWYSCSVCMYSWQLFEKNRKLVAWKQWSRCVRNTPEVLCWWHMVLPPILLTHKTWSREKNICRHEMMCSVYFIFEALKLAEIDL